MQLIVSIWGYMLLLLNRGIENSDEVRQFYEVIFGDGNTEEAKHYISKDFKVRFDEDIISCRIGYNGWTIIEVSKTYPDFKMPVINQFQGGEYIISEVTAERAHWGRFWGNYPTGKRLRFTGVDIDKVFDSKIVEYSGVINTFETFIKEGIIKL